MSRDVRVIVNRYGAARRPSTWLRTLAVIFVAFLATVIYVAAIVAALEWRAK